MARSSRFGGWLRGAALIALWLFVADVLAAQALKLFPRLSSALESKYWAYSPWVQHSFYPYVDRDVPWLGGEYRLKTNALGLKDGATREVARNTSQPRLLVVGDSFAEGQGLPWDDSAVGRIAAALAAEGIDVLNAGTFHTTVPHYRNKVRYLIDREGLSVSHVVVFLDISDIPESLTVDIASDGHMVFPDMEEARIKHFFKTNSVILRTLAVIRDRQREPMKNTTPRLGIDVYDSDWTVDAAKLTTIGRRGIETCEKWLDDLWGFLAERKIGMTLVVYPWATQIWHNDADSVQRRVWREWADRRGAGFVDLFPEFFDSSPATQRIERWYFSHDVHFNAAGAAVMASGFLARFRMKPEDGSAQIISK